MPHSHVNEHYSFYEDSHRMPRRGGRGRGGGGGDRDDNDGLGSYGGRDEGRGTAMAAMVVVATMVAAVAAMEAMPTATDIVVEVAAPVVRAAAVASIRERMTTQSWTMQSCEGHGGEVPCWMLFV